MGRGGQNEMILKDSWKRQTIIPMKHHCTFKIMILEAQFPPALGAVSRDELRNCSWCFLTLDPV